MSRILLFMPSASSRVGDLVGAIERTGRSIAIATRIGADSLPAALKSLPTLGLDFSRPASAARGVLEHRRASGPIEAIIALDDRSVEVATICAAALNLPHNDPEGVRAADDPVELRRRLSKAGIRQARFVELDLGLSPDDASRLAEEALRFPLVLQTRTSTGVRTSQRANDRDGFVVAYEAALRELIGSGDLPARGGITGSLLAESFIDGSDVAVEAILTRGWLEVLGVFDRPRVGDGSSGASIYVTPSRLPALLQEEVSLTVAVAARELGLRHGPIHAELRINARGSYLLDLSPCPIGGIAGRMLRFDGDLTLEDVIVRHALGSNVLVDLGRGRTPAGALVLPIPRPGILRAVRGVDRALRVPGIEDIVITAKEGQRLSADPDAERYLSFVFARGESPEEVDAALRRAHAVLTFDIGPDLASV